MISDQNGVGERGALFGGGEHVCLRREHHLPTPGIPLPFRGGGVGFDDDLGSWQGRSKESAMHNSERDRNEVMSKVGHLEPALEVSL